MTLKVILVFCASLYLAFAKHEQYEGYAVYEVHVDNLEHVEFMNNLENQLNLDVWAHAVPGRAGQVLVPKITRAYFENVLASHGVQFNVAVENIKEKLELEDQLLSKSKKARNSGATPYLPLDTVYEYDEINEYLEEIASKYPEVVTLLTAGQTVEGRDIKYLKISNSNFEDNNKPIVMMQSLLHAREWVTQGVSLYAIQKLVIDVTEQDLLDNIDWIIIPIANPDGFQYTKNSERYWRKNRAANDLCMGVDLNRNFDFNWSVDSIDFVCAATYHGSKAASEPETAAIQNIIQENSSRIKLFIDIHSYSSYILYGYGDGQLPPNGLILNLLGVQMGQTIDAVKWANHPNYIVGNSAALLYRTSGTASDYAQLVGVPLSYTFELPAYNNDDGYNGFLVDPEFIEQCGYETWEAIKLGARFALENYA